MLRIASLRNVRAMPIQIDSLSSTNYTNEVVLTQRPPTKLENLHAASHTISCYATFLPQLPNPPIGSHSLSIDACDPPCDLNHSVKLTLSRALTSFMPPSGSKSARTIGLVPSAREFAALSSGLSWLVVKNAFKPRGVAYKTSLSPVENELSPTYRRKLITSSRRKKIENLGGESITLIPTKRAVPSKNEVQRIY